MREAEFRTWLQQQGYTPETVSSRVSNCVLVCQYEGDPDSEYATDKCARLLSVLTYTTEDERQNKQPNHQIPINGNIRNGTATLKSAIRLYIRFLQAVTVQQEALQAAQDALDSYAQFFDHFGIEKTSFYEFGLDNTVFADMEGATAQWNALKQRLTNNQPIAMRRYGRQGNQTELFLSLYSFLFNNDRIYADTTNNAAPKRNIQAATGHILGETLMNYQCAHIFGHTKNPLLFEAAWNICLVPKLIDPLTGHEAKGPWPQEYQSVFRQMANKRFTALIQDYNAFIEEHHVDRQIQAFCDRHAAEYDNQLIERFRRNARSEWEPIRLTD